MLRQVRGIIYRMSYNDRLVCETVSKTSMQDVLAFLSEAIQLSDIPDVEKGEVLVNARGTGSFQVHA